jgi:hypothetical protein
MKFAKILTIFCIMAISSCQSQSVVTTSPPEVPTFVTLPAATNVPVIVAAETATSIPIQVPLAVSPKSCAASKGPLPSLSNPELSVAIRPVNSTLGGGLVQSKEFTIESFLYCDSVFQSEAPDFQSDINGLAIYHNWRYDAYPESGPIDAFFGIKPDIRWLSVEGPSTSQGHVSQGQPTGIHLAPNTVYDFSKPTSLRFIYLLQTGSGQLSGAALSFDLQPTLDGLQPSNVLITALSDKELESFKGTLPHVTP